jgi:hypothetical protein
VVVVVGVAAGLGLGGAGFALDVDVLVRIGGVGAATTGVVGTSFSAGCDAVSRPASWRSLFNAVSVASEVSDLLFSDTVHAENTSATDRTSGAPSPRIYFDM